MQYVLKTKKVIIAVLGVALSLLSLVTIYQNLKADDIDLRGNVIVSSCQHIGPWDGNFRCHGAYSSAKGMCDAKVRVNVIGKYKPGDLIQDVYPSFDYDCEQPNNNREFECIAGATRRSLVYNAVPFGFLVILVTLYVLSIIRAFDRKFTHGRSSGKIKQ